METNFVQLGDSERHVSSLAADKIDNVMDLTSFIAEIWDLDQCFEPFITPKGVEMFFQSKLPDTLKTYIVSLISLKLVALCLNKKENFLVVYLIQCSYYLLLVDIISSLRGLAFEVTC